MSIESLKEDARSHEQREEWRKALDLYLTAIRRLDDEPDVGLHNRVGDLYTRLGDLEAAVEHYEAAIDLYMDVELPNNAIAVCRKILRNQPHRASTHLKVGQIRARQGFIPDARQAFLTYAELKMAAGEVDEAMRALVEFADLAPDDVGIRLAIADQMESHGKEEDALGQLVLAYQRLRITDREEEARELEERIRSMDPELDLDDLGAHAGEAEAAADAFPLAEEVDLSDEAMAGFEHTALGEFTDVDPRPEKVEETKESAGASLEGLETTVDFGEGSEEEELTYVPLDLEGGDGEEDASEEPLGVAGPGEGVGHDGAVDDEGTAAYEEESDALPGLGDEEDVEPLPTLDPFEDSGDGLEEAMEEAAGDLGGAVDEGEEEDAAWPALATGEGDELMRRLQARVEAHPEDGERWLALGQELLHRGDHHAGSEALERAHSAFATQKDVGRAMRVVRELILHAGDDVGLHQRLVEYAHQVNDRTLLIPAYNDLAECLVRNGDTEKASAVFQQVLKLDPNNRRAQAGAGLGSEEDHEAETAVSSSNDYVDLGSLILGEEREKTTRWTVMADDPTGDEDADFAKMLAQFKEKVAENLDAGDVKSRYDLGTAYKEMGLLDEAVAEFQAALRADHTHLPTYEMLGQCFLARGNTDAAIRALSRALTAPWSVEDELLGIYYYLGVAHETAGNSDEALEFYDKIFALDINFMDVTERLRRLR